MFYLYEPFNEDVIDHLELSDRYICITPANQDRYRGPIGSLVELGSRRMRLLRCARLVRGSAKAREDLTTRLALRCLRHDPKRFFQADRVLIKDPLAFFSAEWLAETFDMKVVIIVRHPAGVVSSFMRLGWIPELNRTFRVWLEQERLAEGLLKPFVPDMKACLNNPGDSLLACTLMWRVFSHQIQRLKLLYPDWLILRHEDLCRDPGNEFRRIFDDFGFPWSNQIESRIALDSSQDNPVEAPNSEQHALQRNSNALADIWHSRLEPEAIERVQCETKEERRGFGYD